MKKSLIALAVLGAFAGAASAQSSVTIYGFIDQALAKPIGTDDKQVADGAIFGGGSRLGFRGVEDLGGGFKGIFGLEHRLSADTGTQTSGTTFWQGYSTVGLVTPFGMINLGRQYTPAFLMIQNQIDPFGGESVAQGRDTGMRFAGATRARFADSIRYDLSMNGFNFGAAIAEGNANNGGGPAGDNRAWSVAANYAMGPFWVGAGIENNPADDDKAWNIGGRWNAGFATFALGYGRATSPTGLDANGWLVGATVPFGAIDIKAQYSRNDVDVVGETKKAGLGVHYNFSKRTKVYANVGRIGGSAVAAVDHRTGYDLGIKHSF